MTATGPSLLSSLDLRGRAFRAREGRTALRGWVTRTSFDGTYARIEITDVERKGADDGEWSKVDDFDAYIGHTEVTSVRAKPDGSVSVSLMYIGQVHILPPGATP